MEHPGAEGTRRAEGRPRASRPGRCAGRPRASGPGGWAGKWSRASRTSGSGRPGRPGRSGRSERRHGHDRATRCARDPRRPWCGRDAQHRHRLRRVRCRLGKYRLHRTLQFIPQDDGNIQIIRTYRGTFTTIAGVAPPNPAGASPASTCATAPLQTGGVTGTVTGFDVVVVTGGVFNPNGTCPDPCSSADIRENFFPAGGGPVATGSPTSGWEYQYDAGANGHWVNRSAARGGDIGNING